MSLLEDIRAAYCGCDASESRHGDDCIETLQPKIVAALEAATHLTGLLTDWRSLVGDIVSRGDPGSHVGRLEIRDYRELFRRYDALRAATTGEEVTE